MTATVTTLLSPTQKRVLAAIRGHFVEHGYSPSLRDLSANTGLVPSAIAYQLLQLQEKGWIRRHPHRSRAIVVLDPETGQP